MRELQREEEEVDNLSEDKDKEEVGGFMAGLDNLTIETVGTGEEAAEGLDAALEMEVDEYSGNKGEDEGGGT